MRKKIIAIIGGAGTGKDSLVEEICSGQPKIFHKIIPCTTRPKRENEIDGKEYYFLTPQEFENYASARQILDNTFFKTWHYGSRLQDYSSHKVNIGVFNPNGVRQMLRKKAIFDLDITVYQLEVDPKTTILRQLNREKCPDVDEIARRHLSDKRDFEEIDFQTIKLPNKTFDNLSDNIKIIAAEAQKWHRDNIY